VRAALTAASVPGESCVGGFGIESSMVKTIRLPQSDRGNPKG
jgi:hypothetical protein